MKMLISFFTEDTRYKLLALVIAFALWAYVGADKNPSEEAVFTSSAEAVNIPSGYNLNMPKNQITVVVKAPRSVLLKIRPEAVRLWVDLKGVSVEALLRGEKLKVNYSLDNVNSKKVKVSVNPSVLEVSVSRMNNVYMPVNVLYGDAPPAGYIFKRKMVSDNTVSVSGSEKEIGLLSEVRGVVPALNEKGFSGQVTLKAYSKDGKRLKNLVISPSTVTITVVLDQEITRKNVFAEPDLTGSPAPGCSLKDVSVNPETILAEGPLLILKDVRSVKTEAVDLEGASKSFVKKAKCLLPAGISAVNGDEVDVSVEIGGKE